ncbi:Helicase ATP-binding domain-containing protein [Entamoeba marina]
MEIIENPLPPPIPFTVEEEVDQLFSVVGLRPYEHQMNCLKMLVRDLELPHSSQNYLMQHATGSGKSMTIASLAHFLYNMKSSNNYRYDKIIIINDRVHLDTQLHSTVKTILSTIDHVNVRHIQSTLELQNSLQNKNCRIFCTTLQKFSFVEPNIPSDINIAIISDEAHRSYGSSSSRKLNTILSGEQRQNSKITYFSFTATPTTKCLRLFGSHKDGLIRPFHCFSLAEAEAKGLIMNVLKNYSVVPKMYHLEGSVEVSEQIQDGRTVAQKLSNEIRHSENLMKRRALFIVNHFTEIAEKSDTPNFKGLAMIVCRTRKSVIRYTQMLRSVITELGKDHGVFGVFTETDIDGVAESEEKLNTIKNIRFIVAADKLQTGFDEPRLMCMYVDKPLSGAHAIQTLGRLDRTSIDKKEVYVVDFANQTETLREAWATFYHEAVLFQTGSDSKRLEIFEAVKRRLRMVNGMKEQNLELVLASLDEENMERKIRLQNPLRTDLLLFLKLVDYFQNDTDEIVKYQFVSKVYAATSGSQNSKTTSLTQLLKSSIDISISDDSNFTPTQAPITPIFKSTPLHNNLTIYQRKCREMTSTEVVKMAERMVDGNQSMGETDDSLSDFSNAIYSKNNRDLLRGIVNKYTTTTPVKRKLTKKIEINAFCRQNVHCLLGCDKVTGTLRLSLKEVINSKTLEGLINDKGIQFLFGLCEGLSSYEASFGQAALQVILDCTKSVYTSLLTDNMFDINYLINVFCQNSKFLATPALKILVRLCTLFPMVKKYVLSSSLFIEKLNEFSVSTHSLFLKQAIDSFVKLHLSS